MLAGVIFALTNAVLYARHFGLVRRHWRMLRRLPDIADPKLYAERMLWRKTVDHNPRFVLFSDKLATKDFLSARCPELALPRTLWTGREASAIPDELLCEGVYVKANHGCNYNYRIRGEPCDRAELGQKSARWLRTVYGRRGGEWGYSEVEPKLFVEEAVGDPEAGLIEFNVRAGNGRAILGSVMGHCKTPRQWSVYLDPAGAPTPGMKDPDGAPIALLPDGLDVLEPYLRAVRLAEKLSVGVDYARFDFMWNGTALFGSEITVYPAGGEAEPANAYCSATILNGWDLLQSHFLQSPHAGWTRIYADALRRRLEGRIPAPVESRKERVES